MSLDSIFEQREPVGRPGWQKALPWVAGVVVGGVAVAVIIVFFWNTGHSTATRVLTNVPADDRSKIPPTVKLPPAATLVARRFIETAVARKHLPQAYSLVTNEIRQGQSLKSWNTGNIAVVPYPVADVKYAPMKIDYSYPNDALIEVALLPKAGTKIRSALFQMELVRRNGKWLVTSWTLAPPRRSPTARRTTEPAASAAQRAGDPRETMKRRLASPRFRRRFLWSVSSLCVLVGVVGGAVYLGNTGRSNSTPLIDKPAWVYHEPPGMRLTEADKQNLFVVASRFIKTAVARKHLDSAWDMLGPEMKAGQTRKSWDTGFNNVVPFPAVGIATWNVLYAYNGDVAVDLGVVGDKHSDWAGKTFTLELKRYPAHPGQWLVASWVPKGIGGGGQIKSVAKLHRYRRIARSCRRGGCSSRSGSSGS